MNWIIRFISKRRLSVFDIGAMGAILFSWNRAETIWLAVCLFVAWCVVGALMDAHVEATTEGKE